MATTTNYGWTTPDDTALVKDGASAIRSLGTAIDTSMFSTNKAGLIHLNTTSFSAVSSQAVSDVFSATYENYRLLLEITSMSADAAIYIKMRVSGTDNSTNYYSAYTGILAATGSFNINHNPVTSGFWLTEGDSGNSNQYGWSGDLLKPFLALPTRIAGISNASNTLGAIAASSGGGVHAVNTSYTSLNIIPSTGNITGNIRIYGYRQ